jgi:hypothetical protein
VIDLVVGQTATKQTKLDLSIIHLTKSLANIVENFSFFFTKSVVKSREPIAAPRSLTQHCPPYPRLKEKDHQHSDMATKFHSSSRSDEVPVQARFLELVETLGIHRARYR